MSMTETEELEPIAPERDSRSIVELIDHLEYLVHRAQRVPFTHNVMIDEDEILDLLDQIHVNLPEEIKQARTVLAEQERLSARPTRRRPGSPRRRPRRPRR